MVDHWKPKPGWLAKELHDAGLKGARKDLIEAKATLRWAQHRHKAEIKRLTAEVEFCKKKVASYAKQNKID